jgi:hypothetical protein
MKPDVIKFKKDGKTFFSSDEPRLKDQIVLSLMDVEGEFKQFTTKSKRTGRKFIVKDFGMLGIGIGMSTTSLCYIWLHPKTEIFIFNK